MEFNDFEPIICKKTKMEEMFKDIKEHSIYPSYFFNSRDVKKFFLEQRRKSNSKLISCFLPINNLIKDKMELNCSICFDFIINACTTICGHTYCEACI